MIIKLDVPDRIIKSFDLTASQQNITTDKVIEVALMTFYNIGFLSDEDQETIMDIIDNGNK